MGDPETEDFIDAPQPPPNSPPGEAVPLGEPAVGQDEPADDE